MQLEVHDQKLKKILNKPDKLIKILGLDMARTFQRCLNEMMSMPNFLEYVNSGLGKPHCLIGNLKGLYGINLNKNYRLIVEPLVLEINDISLKNCKNININIKGVVDYHGNKIEWLIP